MNEVPWGKRAALKRLLAAGASKRTICAALHCAPQTVVRYRKMWLLDVTCGCGQPSGHPGWCSVRLDFSPKRRGWLAQRWKKRGGGQLAAVVDQALAAAKVKGHQIGRFVWASAESASVAYAFCLVCGKQVRVYPPGSQWDRYEGWSRFSGTAVKQPCKTDAERAAETAMNEEKREWRKARQKLDSLRRALRDPSQLHAMASSPAATSPLSSRP